MNKLRNSSSFFAIVIAAAFLQSCGLFGGKKGGRKLPEELNARIKATKGEVYNFDQVRQGWDQYRPQSMVVIPAGTFHMGQADEDVPQTQINYNKQITISAFYMDETEVTNNQYRLFTETLMAYATGATPLDPDYEEDVMKKIFDPNGAKPDSIQVMEKAYPNVDRWVKDYAHHMGDPMLEYYFDHPAFDDFPVVGIKWTQATLFCQWRTMHLNRYRVVEQGLVASPRFRLPTEAEWEYSAKGGRDLAKYPWGNPYTRNTLGCMLANFKPGRGNYYDDGFSYTAPVASYFSNDWGLYDMAGNVAEWCQDAYYESASPIVWDINPVYDPQDKGSKLGTGSPNLRDYPKRMIRGGSWKDIAYYLETGTRTYQFHDSASSAVGFRCAMTYLGRSSGSEYGSTKR